ncbi:ImmA/IrrE family metallo-endopeptidase [Microbacterium sp. NPDC089696]|jgi:Zn-dependent peptidase ImmA (M78 family)|uniref:ImmA/IrrE family metallo-endopeptidase n=1 Tax=Microbacterium sp. NPDC089696 TaxID=3364199 RepID=UPI003806BC48
MDQLLRLLDEHGLRLIEQPGPSRGGYRPETSTIRVAPGQSARTTRSIIAHELGHAVLGHEPTVDPAIRARQELRADEWAARLLIAPEAYAEAEALRDGHPASMAFDLGVAVDLVLAYRRLLRRLGDATYVDARMGAGQWAHRAVSA